MEIDLTSAACHLFYHNPTYFNLDISRRITEGHNIHVYEVYAHEVHAYKVHAHEIHAHDVHTHEMHAVRYTPLRYAPMMCTPVRYTPMRCTPMKRTPVRYTPMRQWSALGRHAWAAKSLPKLAQPCPSGLSLRLVS